MVYPLKIGPSMSEVLRIASKWKTDKKKEHYTVTK
jgi:hypothetical protein